jgi:dCTP diphosphatase
VKLNELLGRILRFRDERDWAQFHTPKNLAAALAVEVSEIQELLLWKTDTEVLEFMHSTKGRSRLEEEIADVLIYALLLSFEAGVDPSQAIKTKLVQNAKKYPVDLSRGNAVKYSERLQPEPGRPEDRRRAPEEEMATPAQKPLFPPLV